MYFNSVFLYKYPPWNTKDYYKIFDAIIYYIFSNWLQINILTLCVYIVTYIKVTIKIK